MPILLDCESDEMLCRGPGRAGELVAFRKNFTECVEEVVDVGLRDRQGGQELDDIDVVSGYLSEDMVLIEQRHCDGLREEPPVGAVDERPGGAKTKRFWSAELNADHESLAANVEAKFEVVDTLLKARSEPLSEVLGVFDQVLGFQDVERG